MSLSELKKELALVKNERDKLVEECAILKCKNDELLNDRFVAFKLMDDLSVDAGLEIYRIVKEELVAEQMSMELPDIFVYQIGHFVERMFEIFVEKYYINVKYPNLFLKEKRGCTYRYYDGTTFRGILTKYDIVDKIIKYFAERMIEIINYAYPLLEYSDIFDGDIHNRIIIELEPVVTGNKQYIAKYYRVFECIIMNNHANIFN